MLCMLHVRRAVLRWRGAYQSADDGRRSETGHEAA
jgi:hypothetical protein